MKRTTIHFAILMVIVLPLLAGSFISCKSKKTEFKQTKDGLAYLFHERNEEARKPESGEILKVRLSYGSKDSVFFHTKNLSDGFMYLPLQNSEFPGDIYEALAMMHLGDSATFMISASDFFLKTANYPSIPDFAKNMDKLYVNVRLLNIQTEDELQAEHEAKMKELMDSEAEKINEYLRTNNYNVQPTPSGLYYIEKEAGKGSKPKTGDVVVVHYTGTLLDGKKFDSSYDRNSPFEFTLGVGQVIKGWDEGIAMMTEGTKAILVIPSKLAYGERGAGRDIPPYAPLVFEVELIKIKN